MFNSKEEIADLTSKLVNNGLSNLDNQQSLETKEFNWLLNSWDSKTWRLTGWNGSETTPIYIHWRQLLPNGLLLTNKRYEHILSRSKLLLAAMRTGNNASTSRSGLQLNASIYLFALIRWMILVGYDDHPYTILSFESLTEDDYERYIESISNGIPGLEMHLERCLEYLNSLTNNQLEDLRKTNGSIDRKKLGRAIYILPARLFKPKIDLFLLNYEIRDTHPTFIVSKAQRRREFMGNRQKTLVEAASLKASASTVRDCLNTWSLLRKHSTEINGLISIDPFKGQTIDRVMRAIPHEVKGLTPNIPIDIGLFYLDSAIKWVVDYGLILVEYYHCLEDKLAFLRENRTARRDHYAPTAFELVNQPDDLSPLNIVRMNKHGNEVPITQLRKELSCEDAVECLEASCFIVIASLSARRLREVLNLDDECIIDAYDGYDIRFLIEKASPLESLETLQRPIPHLVSLCVLLLKKLHIRSDIAVDEHKQTQVLFSCDGKIMSPSMINRRLDRFADIIEVPTYKRPKEAEERRWYLRSHELRKFFAFTYFWKSKHSNLPALSWFMGHASLKHTEEYLKSILAGDEIPESKKILTREAIFNENALADNMKLKQLVLKNFNVETLELIDEREFDRFIERLNSEGRISIEVIDNATLKAGKEILVKLHEKNYAG
jgi:hypothetical protein